MSRERRNAEEQVEEPLMTTSSVRDLIRQEFRAELRTELRALFPPPPLVPSTSLPPTQTSGAAPGK